MAPFSRSEINILRYLVSINIIESNQPIQRHDTPDGRWIHEVKTSSKSHIKSQPLPHLHVCTASSIVSEVSSGVVVIPSEPA